MNNVSLSGKAYGLATKIVGPNKTEIASFRIGVYNNRSKKSFYYAVTVFGKNEFMSKFFSQDGALVEVCGRLETEEWEKDGVKHSKTVIVANDIDFVPKVSEPKTENAEVEDTPKDKPSPTQQQEDVPLPSDDEIPF